MSKVSVKRQVTLPAEHCKTSGIRPGDEVEIFIHEGHLTVVKKAPGSACGLLRDLKSKLEICDEQSLQSVLE